VSVKEPCAKGTLVKGVVAEVKARLESGDLSHADLDRLLKPEDRELLTQDVLISNWYPIECYARLCECLVVGSRLGRREALLEAGRRSAQRVVAMGLYSQVDSRTEGRWEDRVGRVLVSLYPVMFNFSKWEWQAGKGPDLTSFAIVVKEAGPMPETVRLRTQGFVEYLTARAAGRSVTVTFEEPDRDTLVFRGVLSR